MRTYPLNQARSEFSQVFDRAIAGEPQRITRYGKEAVVMVAESDYVAPKPKPKHASLGALLADYARNVGFSEDDFGKEPIRQRRPLGSDFVDDSDMD